MALNPTVQVSIKGVCAGLMSVPGVGKYINACHGSVPYVLFFYQIKDRLVKQLLSHFRTLIFLTLGHCFLEFGAELGGIY